MTFPNRLQETYDRKMIDDSSRYFWASIRDNVKSLIEIMNDINSGVSIRYFSTAQQPPRYFHISPDKKQIYLIRKYRHYGI